MDDAHRPLHGSVLSGRRTEVPRRSEMPLIYLDRMNTLEIKCHRCVADLPERLQREIKTIEKKWK